MFTPPPLPSWDHVHPIVVHVPIALVMVVPLLVVLALLWRSQTRVLLVASALLMLVAAGGAVLAASSGEAGEGLAERLPAARGVLERHEELGEAAEYFTIGLAGALAITAGIVWVGGEKMRWGVIVAMGAGYLAAHMAGMLVVANAAHQGGRLVHEIGVHAMAPASGGVAPSQHDD